MATPELCTALALQMLTIGTVRRGFRRTSADSLPPAAFGALALLDRYGPLRLGELSEHLGTDLSVTSRHATHLVKQGLLERRPTPDDGRGRLLFATAEGRGALRRAEEHWSERLGGYLRDWPDEDVRRLTDLLGRLRESFDAAAAQDAQDPHGR